MKEKLEQFCEAVKNLVRTEDFFLNNECDVKILQTAQKAEQDIFNQIISSTDWKIGFEKRNKILKKIRETIYTTEIFIISCEKQIENCRRRQMFAFNDTVRLFVNTKQV